jgi:hypothetical protein
MLKDRFGEPVGVGDKVLASRPNAYGGSSYIEYCEVTRIGPNSFTLQELGDDNSVTYVSTYNQTEYHRQKFVLQRKKGKGDLNETKIVRYAR